MHLLVHAFKHDINDPQRPSFQEQHLAFYYNTYYGKQFAAKLYGVPMLVAEFEHLGLGQWFRYFTGSLELIGAILILLPPVVAFGGVLLSCIMVGATISHLFVIGGSPVPALVLLTLSAIVAYAKRSQFALLASVP